MVNVKDQTLSPLVDHADLLEHLPELDETDLSLTDAAADSAVPGLIFISAANLCWEPRANGLHSLRCGNQ
jgi:hypothetical protein